MVTFSCKAIFLVIFFVHKSFTQEEYLDDQGRYVFNAPASIKNKHKVASNSNFFPNVIIPISRPSVAPFQRTVGNSDFVAAINSPKPNQNFLPQLQQQQDLGQFPPLVMTAPSSVQSQRQELLLPHLPQNSGDQFPPLFVPPNIQAGTTSTTTVRPRNPRNPQNPQLATDVRVCLHACRTTTEFNPVCGTDGISYANAQKLHCAKRCGQDVQSVRQGRCRPFAPIQN